MQVPDGGALIRRLHELAERVGDEQAVDEAGRLLPRVRRNRIELRRQERDILGGSARVFVEQARIIGGPHGPVVDAIGIGDRVLQQGGIASAAWRLNIIVVADEADREILRDRLLE